MGQWCEESVKFILLAMNAVDVPLTSRVARPKSKTIHGQENKDSVCVICADEIEFAAYTPCQHVTCHRCALRQRVLYEKDVCLICRTPNDVVLISDEINGQYGVKKGLVEDVNLKLSFNSESTKSQAMAILDLKCTIKNCNQPFDTIKDFTEHIREQHNRYICLICYNNKRAFIDELPLYHYKSLQNHQTMGDQKGFPGHPACKYCNKKRFYSEDELSIHIRDNHERCFICDRDSLDIANYYKNYDSLYEHFRINHYVCGVQSCLDKKFVVFRDDLDLTAHMLKEHGNLTSNKVIYKSHLSENVLWNKKNDKTTDKSDSLKTKQMRLEERAKHYLEYNNDKVKIFMDYNNSYKNSKISAEELYNNYKQLFSNQTIEEVVILLTEVAELYPSVNKKHSDLTQTIERLTRGNQDMFPILGNHQAPTVNLHGWGNIRSKSSSPDNFPVLQKKTITTKLQKPKPIRYTTIKTEKADKKPPVTQPTNLTFSYLEASSSSSSSSPSNANSGWANKPKIKDLDKFPALEAKQQKKKFGNVKEVTLTPALEWGPQLEPPKRQDDWLVPVIDNTKKLKKLKKQILFSNNF